jgi:hypothetical protein
MKLGVEHAQRDRCCSNTPSGDKGIVAATKPGVDIGHELAILQGVTGGDKLVGETLHVGQEFRSSHLQLLGVRKRHEQIGDAGFTLSREHLR